MLQQDISWLHDVVRAKHPQRLPVVLTQDEVAKVLRQLSGVPWIMGTLLYGAGLRLLECLRLRVKDLDFAYNQIVVRDGKGQKDRVTMLPQPVKTPLQQHLQSIKQLHTRDLEAGHGAVYLPYALERKYPHANRDWVGNTCFLPPGSHATRALASSGGIIPTNRCSNGRCMALYARRASQNLPPAIHCGMPLRRIYSKRGMTSARCRNCSFTRTSGRR